MNKDKTWWNRPPSRLVDKTVQGFSSWHKSLREEDVLEVGSSIQRPVKDLTLLYSGYRKVQSSELYVEARGYYYD